MHTASIRDNNKTNVYWYVGPEIKETNRNIYKQFWKHIIDVLRTRGVFQDLILSEPEHFLVVASAGELSPF